MSTLPLWRRRSRHVRAELGEHDEVPSRSPVDVGQAAEPPGRAELMAALRASVELAAAKEAPLPANRRRRKPRPHEQGPTTPAEHAVPPPPELPPVNNAVLWHVDNAALPLSEPRRYRDRAHLEFVGSQPCLLCGWQPCDAHHLRFMQPRALGRRVSDEFAVPLCRTHHRALHRSGDETAWWKSTDLDPVMIAHRLWQHTRLNGVPIQQHIDPMLGASSSAELFHTASGTAFADLMINGHRETWPVRSIRFRSWLRRRYYQATGEAPSPAQFRSALGTLEARAQFDAPRRAVYMRVAEQDGRLYWISPTSSGAPSTSDPTGGGSLPRRRVGFAGRPACCRLRYR
jgi:hypothetical protein